MPLKQKNKHQYTLLLIATTVLEYVWQCRILSPKLFELYE